MIEIPDETKLSGLVLLGTSQMLVGLSDSMCLRIPLSAYPALRNLSEEDFLDYRLAANRAQLQWPLHDISLDVRDLAANSIALENGDRGPD